MWLQYMCMCVHDMCMCTYVCMCIIMYVYNYVCMCVRAQGILPFALSFALVASPSKNKLIDSEGTYLCARWLINRE